MGFVVNFSGLLMLLCFYSLIESNQVEANPPGFFQKIIDDWHCKLNLAFHVDGNVESYYNQTGNPCKVYCVVKSWNDQTPKTYVVNSPCFRTCGNNRFCFHGICTPETEKEKQQRLNEGNPEATSISPPTLTPTSSPTSSPTSAPAQSNSPTTQMISTNVTTSQTTIAPVNPPVLNSNVSIPTPNLSPNSSIPNPTNPNPGNLNSNTTG